MRITFLALALLVAAVVTGCSGPRHGTVSHDAGGPGETLVGSYVTGHASSSGARDYIDVLSHPGYF